MPQTELDVTEVLAPSAIEALTRGEIDVQVATAKRYPRQLRTFTQRVLDMATLNQETAESCIYALPRDGKTIEGPSARFAEIVASAWGNLRGEGRIVGDDGKMITGRGTCIDLENNVAFAVEVQRRVTDKRGNRYKDDMIGVTGNAAISIAVRNVVLKVVPKVHWQPAYLAARKVAVGDASTLVNRRAQMLTYFLKLGASNDKVFTLLGVTGADDITLDHLATLKGLATAIKEGDTTVDQAFSPGPEVPDKQVQRLSVAKGGRPAETKADAITIVGIVHELEQAANEGYYWLTLRTGERLLVANEADVAELLKFGGTDHTLRFTCAQGPDSQPMVQSFAIAD